METNNILEWIKQNSTWVFSGIGVSVISGMFFIIKLIFFRPNKKNENPNVNQVNPTININPVIENKPNIEVNPKIEINSKIENVIIRSTTENKEHNLNIFKNYAGKNYAPNYDIKQLVDRTGLLEIIHKKLQEEAMPIFLQAMGGIGKTTIAKAYISKQKDFYDHIFWVTATQEDLRIDLLNTFEYIRNAESDIDQNFKQFIFQARNLEKNVLLVIDNIVEYNQVLNINKYLDQLEWHVLVTSRTVIDDKSFLSRVINVETLEQKFCKELFYKHYEYYLNEENDQTLYQLFDYVRYHTLIIELLAKVGKDTYSIQELLDCLNQEGISSKKLQNEILDDNSRNNICLHEHILSIFKLDKNLSDQEKDILRTFSLLSDSPVKYEDLTLLFGIDYPDLNPKLKRLYEKGWLIKEKASDNGDISYKCHQLIQGILREQLSPDPDNCRELIKSIADILLYEKGEDYTGKIRYFQHVDSILNYIEDKNDPDIMLLMKNYIRLLIINNLNPKIAFQHAKYLKNYIDNIRGEGKDYELERAGIYKLYCSAFNNYTDEKEKIKTIYDLRQEVFSIYEKYLESTDPKSIEALIKKMNALRNLGNYEESITGFLSVIEELEKIILQSSDEKAKEKYKLLLCDALFGLGLSYNRLSGKKDKKENLLRALDARHKALDIKLSLCNDENHISLIAIYNDIGMTYSYLYDLDFDPKYLEEAEKNIKHSLKIKEQAFGEYSLTTATAYNNIANVLRNQKKLDEAMIFVEKAYNIRKFVLGEGKFLPYLFSHNAFKKIHFEYWKQDKSKIESLNLAKEHNNHALNIAEHIHGDKKENITRYIKLIEFKEKLEQAYAEYEK